MHGMIRLIETQEATVQGGGLPEIQELLEAERPEGFDLAVAPVAMKSGSIELTATGTFARRDQTRMIEAETMDGLRALVPDGWQLLYVVK